MRREKIQIDESISRFLISKSINIGESASGILRRELHIPTPNLVEIDIDDDVFSFLLSKTTSIGESATSILRRELKIENQQPPPPVQPLPPVQPPPPIQPPPQPRAPVLVEFHIPAGTGSGAWNTVGKTVTARVGDTLRLVNNDSVPHRPHTVGGTPFPHPAESIPPGGSADFVLLTLYDLIGLGPIKDHDSPGGGGFFIMVT